MASRIEIFAVTVAANTALAAPTTTATRFDDGRVERVEILIPAGPVGLMGFQLTFSGIPVIPREITKFIIADNEVIKWDLANFPEGGDWGVRAYNTDVFDHTIYLRYLVAETGGEISPQLPPLPIEQLAQEAPFAEIQSTEAPPIGPGVDTLGGEYAL